MSFFHSLGRIAHSAVNCSVATAKGTVSYTKQAASDIKEGWNAPSEPVAQLEAPAPRRTRGKIVVPG